MSLSRDDLRAAVAAGMISEAQAASVLALSEARAGVRERMEGRDEPFELFRGFNEIFIVVGLVILYAGWMGVTGLSAATSLGPTGLSFAIYAAITMAVSAGLAGYFTLRRRMVAPSIALTVMFGLAALQLGASLGWQVGLNFQQRAVFTAGLATMAMLGWYGVFRIPFSMALVALGVFATAGAALIVQGAGLPRPQELFLLSADGPFAALTIVLGLIGLAVALAFDMSDPHRVTRRSATGFWLHVVAAPAIVNTVALTLFTDGSRGAVMALMAFLAAMALFALVIDRRSFIVAGVGYVVALSLGVLEDSAMLAILLLGLALVLLGAGWEQMRGSLMRALPRFPGKDRLPPWTLLDERPPA
ncbi:hypothetical protein [Rhodovulum sp. 12E13]|uniref:hypothetical protein n=1 Tax=Rhodovulum sp. 12E13 TaxID=2203891 RepID=UPI001F218408|nr:hypothetical protein [Rhodovulum sp. 12E13]